MKIAYTKRALADLKRIQAYTKKHSPRGAARIGARIRKRIGDLLQFPDQGALLERGGRRMLVVTQTPYLVVYRVTADIEILAVLHSSQESRE